MPYQISPMASVPYAPDNSGLQQLLMQQGQQRANSALASGQIWQNAIGGIGNAIAGGIQAHQQDKADQQRIAIAQQKADQDAKRQQQEFEIKQQQQKRDDEEHIQKADLLKSQIAESNAKLQDLHNNYAGRLAQGVEGHLNDPDSGVGAAMYALDHAEGVYSPEQIAQYKDMIQKDPTSLKTFIEGALTNSKEQQERIQKQKEFDLTRGDKNTDNARQQAMLEESMRHNRAAESQAAKAAEDAGATTVLTPEGRALAARSLTTTGQMIPLGMGKAAAAQRAAIINEAAAQDPTLNLGASKAGFAANSGALNKLQAQTDAVSAFEKTAQDNSKMLDGIMKDLPDTGSSLLNSPLRKAASVMGSEKMTAFNTARQSVANEYARILANPNLSGTMSDSARHEAEVLLSPDATVGQIRSALKTLAQEAGNRHKNYSSQLDEIKVRIGGKSSSDAGTVHRKVYNPATGDFE